MSTEKRPQTSQRGRIVEGVVKLSSTFSNELSVCVGDDGHGQVFSPKWLSVGVRFGSDSARQRTHICQGRQMWATRPSLKKLSRLRFCSSGLLGVLSWEELPTAAQTRCTIGADLGIIEWDQAEGATSSASLDDLTLMAD